MKLTIALLLAVAISVLGCGWGDDCPAPQLPESDVYSVKSFEPDDIFTASSPWKGDKRLLQNDLVVEYDKTMNVAYLKNKEGEIILELRETY